MVSSVEGDGSQQVAGSTERETEVTITRIKTVKTTHQGAMETKVETVVRRRTHSSKTRLGTSQECRPSATQSPVATITTLPSPPSTPTTTRKSQSGSTIATSPSLATSSTPHAVDIPHPSDLPYPPPAVEAYYLVIVGQEVGIYYTWKDTALRVLNISGAVFYKCRTFQRALADYTAAYNKGELRAIPTPGGPFWPIASCTASPTLSEGEQSYWAEVDDLSDLLGQVRLDHTGDRARLSPNVK